MTCKRPFVLDSAVCSCYYFSDEAGFTWQEGRASCSRMGGDLLVINSTSEEDQIAWIIRKSINRMNTRDKVQKWWIGLMRTREVWQWVDGAPGNINRVLWHVGQPDLPTERDVCAELCHTLLNDVDCSNKRNVICESKPIRKLRPFSPPISTPLTSQTSEQSANNEWNAKRNRYIFLAVISGIALLALIAVFAVICLAVRVRRMKRTYQSTMRQSSFHVDSRDLAGRPPITLPRSEPGLRQFAMNPPAYAEPEAEPHPGYEKLRSTNPRYLELLQ